jgi:DNA repair exonuclease SbcCD ATPase subunit
MIRAHEEMVENIKAFDAAQGMDNGQLAAAAAEVEQVRQRYNSLLEEALENPELAAEVAKAQGMVTIMETKLQRLQAKLDAEKKQYPDGMAVAFMNVQAEIRRRIADGSLLREEFQPMVDEMKEHMQAYMANLAAVFAKMHQVNKSLAHIQHSTASAVLRYTGKDERFGIMGPEQVTESDFKEWAWVDHYHYANDLTAIRKAALEETSPEVKLPPVNIPNIITPKSENYQNAKQL